MNFFTELQRRNVHRAALFYAGAAWLIVQVATQVSPFFDIANSVVRAVILLLLIAFPFAMIFSWFDEWTPQGIRRESKIVRSALVILARLREATMVAHHANLPTCQAAKPERQGSGPKNYLIERRSLHGAPC